MYLSLSGFRTRYWLAMVLFVAFVATTLASPARADDGEHRNTARTTMSVQDWTVSGNDSAASMPTSDVYYVPKAKIKRLKHKCHVVYHKPRKVRVCVRAQSARAVNTRYLVTHARAKDFHNQYVYYKRVAKKCQKHHHWCAHTKKFRNMHVGTCGGPWAPPKWHFRMMCMKWRSGQYYTRWSRLAFYRYHAVPTATTQLLLRAEKVLGPKDTTRFSSKPGWSWFGGPYVALIFSRPATVKAYQKTNYVTDAETIGAVVCGVAAGALSAGMLAPVCTAAVAIVAENVKADLETAYKTGRCFSARYYLAMIGPIPLPGMMFPTAAVNCVGKRGGSK